MDFNLTDEQKAHREEYFHVCKELEKSKPPEYNTMEDGYDTDTGFKYFMKCRKEISRRGWTALNWPAEYGGTGDMMDRVLLSEAMGYHSIPGIDGMGVSMLAPTLLAVANDDVKKRFLPPIAAADVTWCELWSEPNAGSDLASLTTTAIKKGDKFIINGQNMDQWWSSL